MICANSDDLNDSLINSAEEGDLDTIKSLIQKVANANAKNDEGVTAIMWASKKGHLDIAEYLIAQGANTKLKDKNGKTAMEYMKSVSKCRKNYRDYMCQYN